MEQDITAEQASDNIKEKIRHVLTIYPLISHTMLQAGIGPQIQPKFWRPILDELISRGEIKQEDYATQSPAGRYITYTRLSLSA
jgi:hypothetical protein